MLLKYCFRHRQMIQYTDERKNLVFTEFKIMLLTERLKKIADCINCDTLADIGTDHGYIPIYCAENGRCRRGIACDINAGPLRAATENIAAHGLTDKIETRLSDGLDALAPMEADTIVVAGMGGFLIRDIIARGSSRIGDDTLLVLQPMVAAAELREFLCDNGFFIEQEYLAREDCKFYNIICARRGEGACTERDILLGKGIDGDENFGDYLNFHRSVIEKILAGLKKSTGKEKEIAEAEHKLRVICGRE